MKVMWKEENNKLVLEKQFKNFNEAWRFLNGVALLAEQNQHHPTIQNTFNNVKLELTTHDSGNTITEKDRDLASKIEKLF
jgi:4a-hydroxytetrahydrobiopterin dehydratase